MIINRSDCRLYLPFENTIVNSANGTNAYDEIIIGAGTNAYSDGSIGMGFNCNGVNSINVNNTESIGTESIAILCKFKINSFSGQQRIFSKDEVGDGGTIILFNYPTLSSITFFVRNSDNTAWINASIPVSSLSVDEWYSCWSYIDVVAETVNIEIYSKDGTLFTDSSSLGGSTFRSENTWNYYIGSDSDVGAEDQLWNGIIDEFIYIVGDTLNDEDFYRYHMGFGITNK